MTLLRDAASKSSSSHVVFHSQAVSSCARPFVIYIFRLQQGSSIPCQRSVFRSSLFSASSTYLQIKSPTASIDLITFARSNTFAASQISLSLFYRQDSRRVSFSPNKYCFPEEMYINAIDLMGYFECQACSIQIHIR